MALLQEAFLQLVGFYSTIFPIMLYTTWVVLALWDLMGRQEMVERKRLLWEAGVVFLPLVGPLSYLLLSDTRMSWNLRMLVTAGGALVYIVTVAVLAQTT